MLKIKLVLFLVPLVFVSCTDLTKGNFVELGSLKLTFGVNSRVIEPEGFKVSYYQIKLKDPEGKEAVTRLDNTNVFTKDEMEVGSWSINVECFNSDDKKIAEKDHTFTIEEGITSNVSIVAELINGQGDFEINLSWDEGILDNPEMSVSLTAVDDNSNIIDLSTSIKIDNSLAILNEKISTGKYILNIKLIEDSIEKWGFSELVTIVDNLKTDINLKVTKYDLKEVEVQKKLSLNLTVSANLRNSIKPRVWTHDLSYSQGENISIELDNLSKDTDYDIYNWYLNGVLQDDSTSNVFAVGSELVPGRYNYTCIVKKNNDYGSVSGVFNILSSFNVVYNYTFPDIKGSYFDDIEFDDTNFWVFQDDELVCLDSNMKVISKNEVDGIMGHSGDIALDNDYFYISSNRKRIYQVDRNTYSLVETFDLEIRFYEIEWDGKFFWISDHYNLWKYDSSFNQIQKYENPFGLFKNIASFVWVDQKLWVVDSTIEPVLYQYDLIDNEFIKLQEHNFYQYLPDNHDQNTMSGLTFDGENFWFSSRERLTIYKGNGLIF